ncbi:MAG: hypothetical protein V1714_01615 [Pseudomonadota bacterium]
MAKKILILFEDSIIERIDDFRYESRIPSRNEAIRQLIEEALIRFEKEGKKKSSK